MNSLTSNIFAITSVVLITIGTPTWADSLHSFNYGDQEKWHFEAGQSQSPIAIITSNALPDMEDSELKLAYEKDILSTVDNSHSIQVNSSGKAVIKGRNFNLTQFHFHAPSEHTLDGQSYPLESHFVHQAQNGRLAVIGVLYVEGQENSAFESVLNSIKKGTINENPGTIAIDQLLPSNKSYYHYLGSLTTPPLTENVEWYVLSTPVEISARQVQAFKQFYDGNNRTVQPHNNRPVLFHTK